MPRKVVESVKIVIKTEDGNRLALDGKGSAPHSMLTAFTCLSQKRREWLMAKMAEEHAKILAREAQTKEIATFNSGDLIAAMHRDGAGS